jgi:Cu(I)/Ag(I) efflux system membrane fusion protein
MKAVVANSWAFLKVLFVRLRFIFVFVVVGLIVGNWSYILNVADHWLRPLLERSAPKGSAERYEWFCPMHTDVVRSDPNATCPNCGMALTRRERGKPRAALPAGILSRLELTESRIQQAGVATDEIRYRTLVRELRTVGSIRFDERRIRDLSARIAGRADELFVDFTGQRIREGDPVYRIYSPDLVTTQEEYVLALKGLEEVKASPHKAAPGEEDPAERARRLVKTARERLLLWGIQPEQIDELERTFQVATHLTIFSPLSGVVIEKDIHAGHYVQVGEDPYTVADDSVVWIEAKVFERDAALVQEGQAVEILCEAFPGETFSGTVAFLAPELEPRTRTLTVRADIPNPDGRLKPGMYVTAVFRIPLGGLVEKAEDSPQELGTPAAADAAAPASIWVCDVHKEHVWREPGKCEKCGGMVLEERKVPPGGKVVYRCPHHPEVESPEPGTCPKEGLKHDLEYAIVAEPAQKVEEWMCPLHPSRTSSEKAPCPECGREMKRFEHKEVLAVPAAAVIDTGTRKVVWIERARKGVFESVEVVLGPRAGEHYQVLRGLLPGDRVVSAGAFLLDAETRLNPAAHVSYFGATGSGGTSAVQSAPGGHEGHGGAR